MHSNDRSDFLFDIERDIPTTPEDVIALRKNRPVRGENWLEDLHRLTQQLPGVQEALRRRKTFEGCEPFEL
ncbi:MAG TPA: hypothetical protein VN851_26930 [Thermoanaerobaculia bacterium]|nr:hypothetical protein [Thermoanaerobaculia bacterium]